MKRLLFSAAVLAAMVGCQTDSMVGDLSSSDSLNELYFTTSSQKATKSAVDKDATEFNEAVIDNDFGVIIYSAYNKWFGDENSYYSFAEGVVGEPAQNTLTSTAPYNTYDVLYKSNAYVTKLSNTGDLTAAWRIGGETSYWPTEKNLALNVYAYSPHSTTETTSRKDNSTAIAKVPVPTVNSTKQMTIEGYDNTAAEVNLMWSLSADNKRTMTDGYVTGSNEIALQFHRALSQVRFNIALAAAKTSDDDASYTNTTTMVAIKDIDDSDASSIAKAAAYAADNALFPRAAADQADAESAEVYAEADVYLQSIKICNIPTKGDCVASMTSATQGTGTDASAVDVTKWDEATTMGSYTIYTNSSYAPTNGYVAAFSVTDAEATKLKAGKLLTTLVEGNQTVDNYGWAATPDAITIVDATAVDGVLNPFFRPLLISPFASYTTYESSALTDGTTTISDDVASSIDLNTIEADPTNATDNTQPFIEVVFYVQGNGISTVAQHRELAVVRKPLSALLAPNTRVTYSLTVELSILEFSPTVEVLADVDEVTVDNDLTDNSDVIADAK
ncbi:MAG: hypothetical protein R3Y68_03895 [Rikenellaceae bacterium]